MGGHLRIYWNSHHSVWPPDKTGRRWNDKELDELMDQLNNVGLSQVSNAIGSLRFDITDLHKAAREKVSGE